MPFFVALQAAACEMAGQIEEALTLLEEALQIAGRTGERWFAAELHRHKGRLLLCQGQSEAAEELYRKALSIAVEQEASSGNCAPPRASPGCGANRAGARKRMSCSLLSTAGSPRGSTPPI